MSNSNGGIYNPDGINLDKLREHRKNTGGVKDFPGSINITNEELLELECDVLVPGAIENVITENNAAKLNTKLILELANGPITFEADQIINQRGIVSIPDILANSGGVCTSYFEWYQNMKGEKWNKQQVLDKLKTYMTNAFNDTLNLREKHSCSFRNAAYLLAVERLSVEIF